MILVNTAASGGSGGGLTIGTTAITSGTAGRVLFEGVGNVLAQDADLTFDGSQLSVTSVASANTAGSNFVNAADSAAIIAAAWDTPGLQMRSSSQVAWSANTVYYSAKDVILSRGGAGNLDLINGTNAQLFRVFNTYTSAINFECAVLDWQGVANVLQIGTRRDGSGNGNARAMSFVTDNTNRMTIDASGNIIPVLATSSAGLPSGTLWNDAGTVKVA